MVSHVKRRVGVCSFIVKFNVKSQRKIDIQTWTKKDDIQRVIQQYKIQRRRRDERKHLPELVFVFFFVDRALRHSCAACWPTHTLSILFVSVGMIDSCHIALLKYTSVSSGSGAVYHGFEQFQQVLGDAVASIGQTVVQIVQQQQLQRQPSGTRAQSDQNSASEKHQLQRVSIREH